jgi:ribonuclease HI
MIEIFTDGGCRGNPGIGAWAAYVIVDDKTKYVIGTGQVETTNNQMELKAAIEGLEFIQRLNLESPSPLLLKVDSKYVIDCATTWIINWKKNNWQTANKQPVKNKELIQKLHELVLKHQVKFEWVKGHAGVYGNEVCDQAVNEIMDAITGGDLTYKIKKKI